MTSAAASVRNLVFVGGTRHQRNDDGAAIQASEVKFSYAPDEPREPQTSNGLHMSEVKFTYAPDEQEQPTRTTTPVGCPCATL